MEPTILHLDDHLVAIDKPSGMLVHRDQRHPDARVVVQAVRDMLGRRVYPVQRLDKPTSGVMVLALSPEAAAALQGALAHADKVYSALVRWPRWRADPGSVTKWFCDQPLPNKRGVLKPSRTTFELERVHRRCALVRARLHTGRHHQVRRHAHALGHTVLGEPVYGEEWLVAWARGRLGLERLFLHMGSLTLLHPHTGATLAVESPLPADLAAVLRRAAGG